MKQEFSIPSLAARIATEADAYKLMEELRWPGGQPDSCPQCGAGEKFYYLAPRDGGEVRKTRTGADTARRLWKCATCRKKFSVLTGTVFHGSKIPIRTWLFVTLELAASKNGVSAREIERKYNLTPKTAWFMVHRLREGMRRDDTADFLSGVIVADETWIGGDPGNQHARKRVAMGPDRWTTQKTTILSVIDKATGEARSAVVPNVRASTLRKAMEQELAVNLGASTLHTDSATYYKRIAATTKGHESVNHNQGEYVRNGVSTNMAEGFFSQLKRSIDGTHHHVSKEHLPRYLAQFDWLYSNRNATDTERMRTLLGNVGGRRLTYRPLVGNR
ncbi:MAG TPA: IS1595 family transposase [Jatrophihabitans sp.]|jgi:transposase-like protein|uniref:IS1595 family transposase n=1 Tax=Jatrophihabitans sp. TaxID=1932789 RepID=UPI002EEE5783